MGARRDPTKQLLRLLEALALQQQHTQVGAGTCMIEIGRTPQPHNCRVQIVSAPFDDPEVEGAPRAAVAMRLLERVCRSLQIVALERAKRLVKGRLCKSRLGWRAFLRDAPLVKTRTRDQIAEIREGDTELGVILRSVGNVIHQRRGQDERLHRLFVRGLVAGMHDLVSQRIGDSQPVVDRISARRGLVDDDAEGSCEVVNKSVAKAHRVAEDVFQLLSGPLLAQADCTDYTAHQQLNRGAGLEYSVSETPHLQRSSRGEQKLHG